MNESVPDFGACEICGAEDWRSIYSGVVRNGPFGKFCEDARIAACGGCGVYRLDEAHCLGEEPYETGDYRRHLSQQLDLDAHFAGHDHLQIHALNAIAPRSLRGHTIVDVGCGGGSFLDHVRGVASRTIAIDPSVHFQEALKDRGYETYAYAKDAALATGPAIADMIVSFQVIEHVSNPRSFLAEMRQLVRPDGIVVLSTPNRGDILMDLLPDDFPKFFYRVAHRWYFDGDALKTCAAKAGFAVKETRYVHRYGMANTLLWLRDRRPLGNAILSGIGSMADGFWKTYLETTQRADTLFMILVPAN